MATKKFFWLKLQRDFFKRHDIRIIEDMPNGKDYILFYLKLLVESIDHEGMLRFSDTIPYNEQMLATVTNTNIDIVRTAMKVFLDLEMIEIVEDGTIFMNEVNKMIGSGSAEEQREQWRIRQQRHRQKALNESVTSRDSNVTMSLELELEKEKDIEKDNIGQKRKRFTPPKHQDVLEYCNEMGYTNFDIEAYLDYYSSKGWMVGKTKMKDWKASVRNWNRNNEKWAKPSTESKSIFDQLAEV